LIEAVIDRRELRAELELRLAASHGWHRTPKGRHHGAFPV
jgi:hypothetical protein